MVVIPCLCPSSSLKPKGRRPEKTRQPSTKFCSWLYALRHWKTSPVFNVISPSFLRSYSEPLAMYMSAECWWRLQSFYARIMWPKNCSFHRWINWHMQLLSQVRILLRDLFYGFSKWSITFFCMRSCRKRSSLHICICNFPLFRLRIAIGHIVSMIAIVV